MRTALTIASEIAQALEAAHARGILHRDLKPANVGLSLEGRVKVLDFGLAKALGEDDGARGEVVDRRTDIFAFGCVLYELLTRRRLAGEPDWAALPRDTPAAVKRLLERCLRKERERRQRDIGDARLELEEALTAVRPPVVVAMRERPALVAAGILAVAGLVALGFGLGRRSRASPVAPRLPVVRLDVNPGALELAQLSAPTLALSPDGRQVVFAAGDARTAPSRVALYRRELDALEAKLIPGTEGAHSPFFSPDGSWLAFASEGKLKKASLEDGTILTLCDALQVQGGAWLDDETIVFGAGVLGLFRVGVKGGIPERLTEPDAARDEIQHRHPQAVTGRPLVAFTITTTRFANRAALLDLRTGRYRTVLEDAIYPRYAPSGHLLFTRGGVLMAAALDLDRLEATGEAAPLLHGVLDRAAGGLAYYEAGADGTLVYVPWDSRPSRRRLVWVDREGRAEPVIDERRAYAGVALAPDGRRVAVVIEEGPGSDVFVLDLLAKTWTRATHGDTGAQVAWSADGASLLVTGRAASGNYGLSLRRVAADGSGRDQVLLEGEAQHVVAAPNGRSLFFCRQPVPARWDIWRLALEGGSKPEPLVRTPAEEWLPTVSPDGGWLAYEAWETGDVTRTQVLVRSAGGGTAQPVPLRGTRRPVWRESGLFMIGPGHAASQPGLYQTALAPGSPARPATPVHLFDLAPRLHPTSWDVGRDGRRFLMIEKEARETETLRLVVALNGLGLGSRGPAAIP
jgi:serine/threonine-protein kinase